jgi:hypothetical protein
MLLFLLFFCADKTKKRSIEVALLITILYEVFIAFIYGFNVKANIYVLGPGILLVLMFSFNLFVRQMRITIVQGKGVGKSLMLTSVIFSYCCYGIIYFFHYIQQLKAVNDIFLLYFITTLITSGIMAFGVVFIKKHLRTLYELKHTRKELHLFFNN